VGLPYMARMAPVFGSMTTAPASGASPWALVASTAAATWLWSWVPTVRVTLSVVVRLTNRSRSDLAGRVCDLR
jgi:hypothetical protein